MARRGEELRAHILGAAKDVFLEMGFERASMDVMAARAGTSKRSLYAHFESKEILYLAVIDLVGDLQLDKLKSPDEYGEDTLEAVVQYCGRFLQLLLWKPALRTCRLGIAEADKMPDASARYHDVIFNTTRERLIAFLCRRRKISLSNSAQIADELLGVTVYPRLVRALFGLEELAEEWSGAESSAADLALIRGRATALLRPEHTDTP